MNASGPDRRPRSRRQLAGGWSLLELMVVLVIIGLVAGLVGPRMLAFLERGEVSAAELQTKKLAQALLTYRMDVGSFPTTEQGLDALVTAPAEYADYWQGPYLDEAVPLDPWRNRFRYEQRRGYAARLCSLFHGGRRRARRRRRRCGHRAAAGRTIAMPPPSSVGLSRQPAVGFTLLELLVVLALVGLLAALALPNLHRIYDNLARRSERDHILDQIAALGHEAMLRRRAYVVFGTDQRPAEGSPGDKSTRYADYEPYPLDIPAGWQIRLDTPLLVRPKRRLPRRRGDFGARRCDGHYGLARSAFLSAGRRCVAGAGRGRGFTLLEMVVAMAIFAAAGMALYGLLSTNLITLTRVQDVSRQAPAVRAAMERLAAVNPWQQDEGRFEVDGFEVAWTARLVEPMRQTQTALGVPGPFNIGLYEVEFALRPRPGGPRDRRLAHAAGRLRGHAPAEAGRVRPA